MFLLVFFFFNHSLKKPREFFFNWLSSSVNLLVRGSVCCGQLNFLSDQQIIEIMFSHVICNLDKPKAVKLLSSLACSPEEISTFSKSQRIKCLICKCLSEASYADIQHSILSKTIVKNSLKCNIEVKSHKWICRSLLV